ncbi:MAG: Co2+/Mg2+ efflux protein ApaG [Bacteroidia bacterium]|nr:Co2+/Mg2+ efflux protein ApaG [Bacteroidia bacterium]
MHHLPSLVTQGIRVTVRSEYAPHESSPGHQYFVFSYEIEIANESRSPVQLLSREWRITDALGVKRLVQGEGVVGQQPVIAPGASYRYVSGCHFETPVGRMEGFYLMLRQDNAARFEVQIPAFVMALPALSN